MSKNTDFLRIIRNTAPQLELLENESMSRHTSFRVGGGAELMALPKNEEELAAILKASKELDLHYAVLGAGTNVLAPDEGIEGLVILLKDCFSGMERLDDTSIRVMAGVTMSRAAMFAASLGLGGLEFAHGIPGSVGGGVYMNAGAYGGEIKDVCTQVKIMVPDGTSRWISGEEKGFSYRHSAMEDHPWIVLAADFKLEPKPEQEIRDRMQELIGKRRNSQPLDMPSAGSAFKRPVGGYAAALIEQAGLKGYQVGGAAVSTKHAGFVVNLGGATAADVRQVLSDVSNIVFEKFGIRLESEIRIW